MMYSAPMIHSMRSGKSLVWVSGRMTVLLLDDVSKGLLDMVQNFDPVDVFMESLSFRNSASHVDVHSDRIRWRDIRSVDPWFGLENWWMRCVLNTLEMTYKRKKFLWLFIQSQTVYIEGCYLCIFGLTCPDVVPWRCCFGVLARTKHIRGAISYSMWVLLTLIFVLCLSSHVSF